MSDYDRGELQKAVKRWVKVKSGKENRFFRIGDMMAFAQDIGYPHNPHAANNKIVDTDNPEVRRLIDLINGPHGSTILKMLIIRNSND